MLSICMCVKNEAERLEETLNQVFDIADEIVCGIDKTTTDNSKEIVEKFVGKTNKFGRKISGFFYEYTWENDFSKMRNQCMRYATKDWILMIDGHDFLVSGKHVIEQIAMNPDKYEKAGVVDGIMEDLPQEDGTRTAYQRPVMFRTIFKGKAGTTEGVHWEKPIHNIIGNKINERIQTKDIVFQHRQSKKRFTERKEQRKSMNINGLLKNIEKDENDSRSMFYLARTYDEMQDWEKAIEWFDKYLTISNFEEEKYHAAYEKATCYMKLWQKEKHSKETRKEGDLRLAGADKKKNKRREELEVGAINSALDCFKFVVPRNEHLIFLGDVFLHARNRADIAAHYYRMASVFPEPRCFIFIVRDFYSWVPWNRLMRAYAQMGALHDALSAARKYLEYKPEDDKAFKLVKKIREKISEINISKQ